VFLRGHDSDLTCIELSPSGRLVASGQNGYNSDCVVWDFDSKRLMYVQRVFINYMYCVFIACFLTMGVN
jgi:WD40 repeat protein